MKPICRLTSIEKAALLFDLFPEQLPAYLDHMRDLSLLAFADDDKAFQNIKIPRMAKEFMQGLAANAECLIRSHEKRFLKNHPRMGKLLFSRPQLIFSLYCLYSYRRTSRNTKFSELVLILFTLDEPLGKEAEPAAHGPARSQSGSCLSGRHGGQWRFTSWQPLPGRHADERGVFYNLKEVKSQT